jgi:hypothetical protein
MMIREELEARIAAYGTVCSQGSLEELATVVARLEAALDEVYRDIDFAEGALSRAWTALDPNHVPLETLVDQASWIVMRTQA